MPDISDTFDLVDHNTGKTLREKVHDNGDGTYTRVVYDENGGGGGGGAATIADGADVTQGAKADAAYTDATGAASGSDIALLKGAYTNLAAAVASLATLVSSTSPLGPLTSALSISTTPATDQAPISAKIDQTTPGTTNKVEAGTNARRSAGTLHRSAKTAVDKLTAPVTPVPVINATSGALTTSTNYLVAAAAGNKYGTTAATATATIGTSTDTAIAFPLAQSTGTNSAVAEYYDIFCIKTSGSPLWLARITEAQRASGVVISAVATVTTTGGTAGSVIITGPNGGGTGLAYNVAPFTVNNAYVPDATQTGENAVSCAGKSLVHMMVALAVTDLRSMPSVTLTPFLQSAYDVTNSVADSYFQGTPLTPTILTATGQCLQMDYWMEVDGVTNLVVLIDAISGQGTACTVLVETA